MTCLNCRSKLPVSLMVVFAAVFAQLGGTAQSKQARASTVSDGSQASALKLKEADASVYGIHLGEKFSIPECTRKEQRIMSGVNQNLQPQYTVMKSYATGGSDFCFKWRDDNGYFLDVPTQIPANTPVETDIVEIYFPTEKAPNMLMVSCAGWSWMKT